MEPKSLALEDAMTAASLRREARPIPSSGFIALAPWMFVVLFLPASAYAAFRVQSGSLGSYLNGLCIPPSGTEVFEEPPLQDMSDWAAVITALLAGDYTQAADLSDTLLYDLVEFTDSATGCVYLLLVEQRCPSTGGCFNGQTFDPEPCRGLGTYVFNPHARRKMNIQVPHAETDGGTRPEGVAMFLGLQSTFLQMTGTTRCANAASAGCGGPTSACGGSGDYRESDAAHFTNSFFQVAGTTVHERLADVVAVSMHGFAACDAPGDTSFVQISNGTGCTNGNSIVPNSVATQLAAEYNLLLASLSVPYIGRGAGSCNLAPGEPAELERVGCPAFCGGSNTQGRAINGVVDPCAGGVCAALLPERFIHLEQQFPLRIPPPGLPDPSPYPGISWQITIDAFDAVFPTVQMWLDFVYAGPQDGSFCHPFNTLAEAAGVASPGETIVIHAGSSPETIVVDSEVTLRSFGGLVSIGQ